MPATSTLAIERNLDIIAEANWCIDMGPGGDAGGGEVDVEGDPAKLANA